MADTTATARSFIGGEWVASASGETYEKRNPWRPWIVTGTLATRAAAILRYSAGERRDCLQGCAVYQDAPLA